MKVETPPTPSTSPNPSGIHRIFTRKKSKTSYHDPSSPSTPPVAGSPKTNAETSKRTNLFGRPRANRAESHNRNSMGSEPNSSSLRSAANRQSLILNGSGASPARDTTPLPTPPPKTVELPAVANAGPQNAASRFRSVVSPTPTNQGSNTELREVKTPSPDDQTYARRRKRLTKTESQTSKSSGCTTQ